MLLPVLALLVAGAPADCRHIGGSLKAARFDRDVLRPGDETGIDYVYRDGPDGEKMIPKRCITRLEVHGPAQLRGPARLRIKDSAKAGDAITLSMRIGGTPYSRTVKITGTDEQVLTGTWHVVESHDCQARLPSEIRFFDDGAYDFTFLEAMVETMTSGSGNYIWDPESGAFSLGLGRQGIVRFEGRRLEGIEFDFVPPAVPGAPVPPPCRVVLG